jgi:hypothetical protein
MNLIGYWQTVALVTAGAMQKMAGVNSEPLETEDEVWDSIAEANCSPVKEEDPTPSP